VTTKKSQGTWEPLESRVPSTREGVERRHASVHDSVELLPELPFDAAAERPQDRAEIELDSQRPVIDLDMTAYARCTERHPLLIRPLGSTMVLRLKPSFQGAKTQPDRFHFTIIRTGHCNFHRDSSRPQQCVFPRQESAQSFRFLDGRCARITTCMTVFGSPDFDDHEQITFVCDEETGLRAIIAIHWGGPIGTAGGGCRIHPYPTEAAALRDVLRLSRAMSYKLALAQLPGGGAKSVIIADPTRDKTPALLRAFGRAIDGLGGRYIVAEDVGTSPADMEEIATQTEYVVGRVNDTSPATGYGVFVGLSKAVQLHLGRTDLRGLRVAIQGVGGVGYHLARELARAGVRLWASDPNSKALQTAVTEFGATPVSLDAIYDQDVDVFSPCAFGDVFGDATIPRLRAQVVAGGANNQLVESRHAEMLKARGILYAPDFVLNAGGVIAAAQEVARFDDEPFDAEANDLAVREQTRLIAANLEEIVQLAEREDTTTHTAAVRLAKARIRTAASTS